MKPLEIGICSWSIDRHDVVRSIEVTGSRLALPVIQIGFFGEGAVSRADPAEIFRASASADVAVVGSFVAFDGEDYSSIAQIAATGGFTPDEQYASRLAAARQIGRLTAAVGARHLAVHAGTIPHDADSPVYAKLVDRVVELADALAALNVRLLLETGRESADTLLRFLDAVGRPNVGVNFDPGNFVVYGADDPVQAVSKLQGCIEMVHLKDAQASTEPGREYGRAVALGAGDAELARVVQHLRATGYAGPLLVECRPRDTDIEGIRRAAAYARTLLG